MDKKKLLKYLPAHVSKYVYIGILLLFMLLIVWMKWNQNGALKIGDAMLFAGDFDIEVELTVEDRLELESEVKKYDELITNFVPETGEEIDLGSGVVGTIEKDSSPDLERFLKKTENLSKLGENNDAIATLMEAKEYYENNLQLGYSMAQIYTKAWAHKLAAKTYADMIEKNPQTYMTFIKQEILAYIGAGDDDTAGKLYIEYISKGGTADQDIVNGIRALRGLDPQ